MTSLVSDIEIFEGGSGWKFTHPIFREIKGLGKPFLSTSTDSYICSTCPHTQNYGSFRRPFKTMTVSPDVQFLTMKWIFYHGKFAKFRELTEFFDGHILRKRHMYLNMTKSLG